MIITTNKERGIALLLAIIIASLVISIGIVLSTTAFKELNLSRTLGGSEAAYYAAKTGSDCAREWILKDSTKFDSDSTITCNNSTINVDVSGATSTMQMTFSPQTYSADITVHNDGSGNYRIEARGHDQDTSARSVEREVVDSISTGQFCPIEADIIAVVDISGSISDTDYASIKDALNQLVDNMMDPADPNPGIHIGIIQFDEEATWVHHLFGAHSDQTNQALHDAINCTNGETSCLVKPPNAVTNIEDGVADATAEFKSSSDRDDNMSPDQMLIITDGIPTKSNRYGYLQNCDVGYGAFPCKIDITGKQMPATKDTTALAKAAGIQVWTIIIESPSKHDNHHDEPSLSTRQNFMKDLTSVKPTSGSDGTYLHVSSLDNLITAINTLSESCDLTP